MSERCAALAIDQPLPDLPRLRFPRQAIGGIRAGSVRSTTRWPKQHPVAGELMPGDLCVATYCDDTDPTHIYVLGVLQIERTERHRLDKLPHDAASAAGMPSVARLRELVELMYPAIEPQDQVRVLNFACIHRLRGCTDRPGQQALLESMRVCVAAGSPQASGKWF